MWRLLWTLRSPNLKSINLEREIARGWNILQFGRNKRCCCKFQNTKVLGVYHVGISCLTLHLLLTVSKVEVNFISNIELFIQVALRKKTPTEEIIPIINTIYQWNSVTSWHKDSIRTPLKLKWKSWIVSHISLVCLRNNATTNIPIISVAFKS